MKELSLIYKALSDETRLEILSLLLLGGECCVCDVEGTLGITQSKASRHLRYLLNAGLVENKRDGQWMHYLIPKGLDPIRKSILAGAKKSIGKERLDRTGQLLEQWLSKKDESVPTCG